MRKNFELMEFLSVIWIAGIFIFFFFRRKMIWNNTGSSFFLSISRLRDSCLSVLRSEVPAGRESHFLPMRYLFYGSGRRNSCINSMGNPKVLSNSHSFNGMQTGEFLPLAER